MLAQAIKTVGSSNHIKEIARSRIALAQYGAVASLPADIATSASTFKPIFYVSSGALQEIAIQSKVPDAATVSSLGTSAGSVLDAIAKKNKADRDASDELTQLTRQADILEQKVRIQNAQANLSHD